MSAVIDTAPVRGRAPAHKSNESGGDMDDVLKKTERSGVADFRDSSRRRCHETVLPHLATKEDVGAWKPALSTEVRSVSCEVDSVKAAIRASEARLKWRMVGAMVLATSSAFVIAKVVN